MNPLVSELGRPLREEIDKRYQLIQLMVGRLYPQIVLDEIRKLCAEHKRLTGESYRDPDS